MLEHDLGDLKVSGLGKLKRLVIEPYVAISALAQASWCTSTSKSSAGSWAERDTA